MSERARCFSILWALLFSFSIGLSAFGQEARYLPPLRPASVQGVPNLDWKKHNVGRLWQVITNMGTLALGETGYYGVWTEYPAGSNREHNGGAGLWVGAILRGDTLVTTGFA